MPVAATALPINKRLNMKTAPPAPNATAAAAVKSAPPAPAKRNPLKILPNVPVFNGLPVPKCASPSAKRPFDGKGDPPTKKPNTDQMLQAATSIMQHHAKLQSSKGSVVKSESSNSEEQPSANEQFVGMPDSQVPQPWF